MMVNEPHGLDDPEYAAFAWGRYRSILWKMAGVAALLAAAAVGVLWWWLGELHWAVVLGTAAGVFASVLLTAALMGLMFLSSGTGHDEQVEDPLKDMIDID